MGTIAQANASEILYATETTYGTAPTGTYSTARITNAALAQRTGFTQSQQLNTSREPVSVIRNLVNAEGSLGMEFSALSHVTFYESLFGTAASTDVGLAATGTAIDVTTVSSPTAHWLGAGSEFTNVRVGDWVKSTAFTNAANNGTFYVSAKTSNADITIVNTAAVAETTATAVKVFGSRIAVGPSLISMALQQKVPTTEVLYQLAKGCVMTGFQLDITPGEIIRGSFSWIGANVVQSTTSVTTWTAVSVLTTQIANAIDNVIQIREHVMSPAETWRVARFSLNLSSPAEPRYAISHSVGETPAAIGLALRPFVATASMRIYVEHGVSESSGVKDLMDAYLAGTSRNGLAFVMRDNVASAVNDTVFMFQKYKVTSASIPIGGNDQDLFLDLEITAESNSAAGTDSSGLGGPYSFTMHQTKII